MAIASAWFTAVPSSHQEVAESKPLPESRMAPATLLLASGPSASLYVEPSGSPHRGAHCPNTCVAGTQFRENSSQVDLQVPPWFQSVSNESSQRAQCACFCKVESGHGVAGFGLSEGRSVTNGARNRITGSACWPKRVATMRRLALALTYPVRRRPVAPSFRLPSAPWLPYPNEQAQRRTR